MKDKSGGREFLNYSYCDISIGTKDGKPVAYERINLDPRKVLERVKLFEPLVKTISPKKLRALSKWIDLKYPHDADPEIQSDLLLLADFIEKAEKAL